MKNFKRFLFLSSCLSTLFFVACAEQSNKEEGPDQRTAVEPPEQIISIEEAKSMYDNYTERRAGMIQNFEDSNPSLHSVMVLNMVGFFADS